MAAVLPLFPSSTSTITMMQPHPSSSEAFQNGPQGQQHQRSNQVHRNIYNTSGGAITAGTYRGQTSVSPVAPYAFQSTPIMQNGTNPLRQHPTAPQHPRLENRTASAPSVPLTPQSLQQNTNNNRPRPPQVNPGLPPLNPPHRISKDDSTLSSGPNPNQAGSRPLSSLDLNTPSLQPASYATVAKSSPDRYKRNHRRAETSGPHSMNTPVQGGSAMPSGSGMAAVGGLYTHPVQTSSTPSLTTYRGSQAPASSISSDFKAGVQPRHASKDDSNLQRERQTSSDLAKRYRRRSISSMEAKDYTMSEASAPTQQPAQPKTYAAMLAGPVPAPQIVSQERRENRTAPAVDRPTSSHGRNGSNDSVNSGRSGSKASSVSSTHPLSPGPCLFDPFYKSSSTLHVL